MVLLQHLHHGRGLVLIASYNHRIKTYLSLPLHEVGFLFLQLFFYRFKMKLNYLALILFCILGFSVLSQATVRGVVKDEKNNSPIPFAKVKVEGLNLGANTDFDGEFRMKLPEGEYKLVFTMTTEGYLDTNARIAVSDGEELILEIKLTKDRAVVNIQEMVAKGQKTEGAKTLEADDARRREEKGATDGVTTEQMKEKGVTTVADALQTSPGLSVEDGKSVYVRGLGDRYTKTILNSMEIPGLDPDRNAVPLDIFPANVVDNITVYKTFLPKFTGDFTGGLVDITTKDFPSERSVYAKAQLGYNNQATFNDQSLNYQGGSLDWLGFDDGTRDLNINPVTKIPNVVLGEQKLEDMTRSFSNIMSTEQKSNFLDQTYTYAYGNRVSAEKRKLTYGYNVVLNYRNTHRYYDEVEYNEYRRDNLDDSTDQMPRWRTSQGSLAEHNVMWTGLVGQSIKFWKSSISLALFHTQNGISSAAVLRDENFEQNPSVLQKQSLQYTQRSVSNANLSGRHYLDTMNKWKFEWKLSPTYSMIKDPDIRSTALEEKRDTNGVVYYDYTPAVGSEIRRIWRNLNEYNVSGRFDFTYSFEFKKRKSELSFGGLDTYKHREFEVLDYIFGVENVTQYSADPDDYFLPENIWTPESDSGTYVVGNKEPANTYTARQNVAGLYVMNDLPLSEKFNVTYGARIEKVTNWYTGENNAGTVQYNDTIVLDALNVLPSVNMAYRLEKKEDSLHSARHNIFRVAYAMTVARPSFKEKSIAQIYDPIQGRTYNGNIDLVQTKIHNADIRWEYFFGRTELISASAFYKRFIDPIEIVSFNTAPSNIQPLNTGVANLYGAEIEMRKAIGFNKPSKSHLSFVVGANFTYVISQIDMNKVLIQNGKDPNGEIIYRTEKEIREDNARPGEEIGNFRPMFGQSPWIVNAFATFKNDSLGFTFNVSYNVQGKKLAVIGIGSIPDVYEQPFHGLNFKISQKFGANKKWQASISGNNMLLSSRRKFYEAYGYESQVYSYQNAGMTISAAVSLTLGAKKTKN